MDKLNSTKTVIYSTFIALALIVIYFIIANHVTPNTNDASVQAYVVQVTPQVSGRISEVFVKNNQTVEKNQPLFQIEKAPFEYALQGAQADLVSAEDEASQLKAAIQFNQAVIKQREIDLETAQAHYDEYSALAKKGVISKSLMLDKIQQLIDNRALLAQAKQNLIEAQQKLGPEQGGVNIQVKRAQATLNTAALNLQETTVHAPEKGKVTNFNTSVGDYATAGSSQMALITENNKWWIQANFEENNLSHIEISKRVLVSLKMYPGKIFSGHIVAVSHGVNLSDGIPVRYLPYVEKTENWVRLAQRFPVIIQLDDLPADSPLRVGASVRVTVLTNTGFFWNGLAYFWQWLFSLLNYL
ncbi:MAG: secretion protein HlyD family [Gammaproteobacteria bacterium]|jgi:membrane fusion protein (multidrug efflux system)|nr:secretion protein HlyD family [Gammaproteobacteria bacterium]